MPAGKFKPPQMGKAAPGAKAEMAKVYSACRLRWTEAHPNDTENKDNKATCSAVAWNAVKGKGYEKKASGKWAK